MRRRRKFGLWGGAMLGLILLPFALDQASPPPLARFQDRSAVVTDRHGVTLRMFQSRDDKWRLLTRPQDVDPLYLAMLKAYEDKRFDSHWGVDPMAIGRAIGQAVSAGHIVSGASTLTMQTARLLSPRPRTLQAKLIEMARAAQLEARFSKDDVLAMYLTLAPFGGPLEGVRAASLKLFGHEPSLLTPAEAALLIALPQSPTRRRPDRAPDRARTARARVLERAVAAGVISWEAARTANLTALPNTLHTQPFLAPHLAESLEKTGDMRRTTLDARLQQLTETRLRAVLQDYPTPVTASAIIVHAPTAEVLALVANPDYFDRRRAGMSDLTKAIRSPGSALKPFIYGMAFDRLIATPDTLIIDRPWRVNGYAPTNFNGGWAGEVTIAEALTRSLNVPAVKVLERIGPARFDAGLSTVGVSLTFDRARGDAGLAIGLGGAGLTMRQLARLYVALAAKGNAPSRLMFTPNDSIEWAALMDPSAASDILRILRNAPLPAGHRRVASATASAARSIAYKTGTSYGYRDAWAAGVIGEYVIVVWVGRPDGAPCIGCIGVVAAAPVLFDLAGYIENPGAMRLSKQHNGAQAHLRHFDRPGLARAAAPNPVRITFPIDGARMQLGLSGQAPLTALGGSPPYNWLANGAPAGASRSGMALGWRPPGGGYHDLVVIDSKGASASARVFIEAGS